MAFVRQERVEAVRDVQGYWPGAPDLAVEVDSPGDHYAEVEEKVRDWLEAGTRLVVVLNPQTRMATACRSLGNIMIHTEADKLDCSDVVPGFSITVADVFR